MNKISCGICLDLMPLVRDEVASEDSRAAVLEHIKGCGSCRAAFEERGPLPSPDDKKVLRKIRSRLMGAAAAVMVLGALLGVSFSESEDLFRNILIMPAIGAAGALALGNKGLLTPLLPAGILFLWKFIAIAHGAAPYEALMTALYWSLIYGALCLAGALAVILFRFAFGKERDHEKK